MRNTAALLLTLTLSFAALNALEISDEYLKEPSAQYKRLMRKYCKRHYGVDSWKLQKAKALIIHTTYYGCFENLMKNFQSDTLKYRKGIESGGSVNVGVHFVINTNGRVYSLYPIDTATRHAIGYNYCAIGIENVAVDNASITEAQLKSCAKLVRRLKEENSSIEHVFGHHEYIDKDKPHYKLYKALDKKYQAFMKGDPGERFMRKLRRALEEE